MSTLKTFLVCKPIYYDLLYEINPWMCKDNSINKEKAMAQWNNFISTLSKFSNIEIIDQAQDCPDMVFTANCGVITRNKNNNKIFHPSVFYHKERQQERDHFIKWFDRVGYLICDAKNDEVVFEGRGDIIEDQQKNIVWVGLGPRNYGGLEQYVHYRIYGNNDLFYLPLKLIDKRYYHLDTCFVILNDHVMYYPYAFDDLSIKLIEANYEKKSIEVTWIDAQDFVCNCVLVDEKNIVVHDISNALRKKLEQLGFVIHKCDVSEFLKAGGGLQCMVFELL